MNPADYMLKLLSETRFATGADFSKWKGQWKTTPENKNIARIVLDIIIYRYGYGAADGKNYEDVRLRENYLNGVNNFPEKVKGGYWYFSSNVPWVTQRDFFCELLDEMPADLIILDFETGYNEKSKAFALDAVKFLEALEERYPDRRIMIYANRYTYQDWLAFYTDGADRFPLWIAQYPWKTWMQTLTDAFKKFWTETILGGLMKPTLPIARNGADDWELWQYIAASGIGEELGFYSDELDFNQSRRDLEAFIEWVFALREEPPEPPMPPPEPEPEPGLLAALLEFLRTLFSWLGKLFS